jgi:hypothetical protein
MAEAEAPEVVAEIFAFDRLTTQSMGKACLFPEKVKD